MDDPARTNPAEPDMPAPARQDGPEAAPSFLSMMASFALISSLVFFAVTSLVLIPLSHNLFSKIRDHSDDGRFVQIERRVETLVERALIHIGLHARQDVSVIPDPEDNDADLWVGMSAGKGVSYDEKPWMPAGLKAAFREHAAVYRSARPPFLISLVTLEGAPYMIVSRPVRKGGMDGFQARVIHDVTGRLLVSPLTQGQEWLSLHGPIGTIASGEEPDGNAKRYERDFAAFGLKVLYSPGTHDWLSAYETQTTRLFCAWLFIAALLSFFGAMMIGSGGMLKTYREMESARRMLKWREKRLRNIIDNAADGMVTISENGYVSSFNPACERIFGYKAHEVVGRNIRILMNEHYANQHDEAIRRYKETGKSRLIGRTVELEGRHKDGHAVPIELSISEYSIEGTSLFSAIIRDITERKEAQRQIERSRNFLRLVMDNVPDMVFVKDEHFNIVEANPEFLKIYPPAQRPHVVGSTTFENFPPAEVEAFTAQDRIALATGYSEIYEDITFHDGEVRTLLSKKVGFVDQEGQRFLMGLARDVTREKQEQKLLESLYVISRGRDAPLMDKIAKTLAQTQEYLKMGGGILTQIKGERMVVQCVSGEAQGIAPDIGPVSDFAFIFEAHQQTGRIASSFSGDIPPQLRQRPEIYIKAPIFINDAPFGMICFYSKTARPAFTAREESFVSLVTQWIGLEIAEHLNLQKLQEFNRRLIDSNQELDDFAYIASHDLKEPLRGMANFAQFLKEDYADKFDDEGKMMVETLGKMSKRLEILIDSLWQYSRLGRTELAVKETDIGALVRDVVDLMQIEIKQAGGKVTIQDQPPLPVLRCDPVRISEVFRNLIVNALKYNDAKKKMVEVGVTQREGIDGPVFFVRDNGIGIHPDHHELVFKIFKRLHPREAYGGGTGSGLTIIHKIIKKHGGRVWVESDGQSGSTFCFTIGDVQGDGGQGSGVPGPEVGP